MTPERMRAVVLRETGGPEVLRIEEVAIPRPGPGEVLVRVAAFGLNNAEVLQRGGAVPAPPGGIPGLECAGTVAETGAGVGPHWKPGATVAALLRGGGYAEYVCVPAGACMRMPAGLDLATAGAVPEAAATAWWNLVQRGRLRAGEQLLVHGAAGGVGSLAVQMGRLLGAEVIATARGEEKTRLCAELGSSQVIDYGRDDVFAAVRSIAPDGVDVILDNQGGPALADNVAALAPLGRLVVVGTQAGTTAELDLGTLMAGGVEISSSSLGRLDDGLRGRLCQDVEREVLPRIAAGALRPVLDKRFPFDEISAAHQWFSDPGRIGKVVVTVTDGI
ncbi:NAD(P)H-quinone oxidoreductase [Saccharomonospora sp. NPDC046836]|uniref:NAD(P)H-quinone oxidoreductase n=1 Tax=Saccharomonospora sp. NPDC046836 TaxID=3156921 RepID=UPI0033D839A9